MGSILLRNSPFRECGGETALLRADGYPVDKDRQDFDPTGVAASAPCIFRT
jgi:hypothetical protein